MPESYDRRRRKFLRYSILCLAGSSVISCKREPSHWRILGAREGRTLLALCDQIIPPDDAPGGADCGVVTYIDRQLGAHYAEYRQLYETGLEALDACAAAAGGSSFASLPGEKQKDLLARIEKNDPAGADWKGASPRRFFAMVVDHSMQGYYGDPRHGGNVDMAAWKMIRVPTVPVRGRQQFDIREAGRG